MTSLRLNPSDQEAYAESLGSADARVLELAREFQRLAFDGERDYSAVDFVPAPLYLKMARNLGSRHLDLMRGVLLAVTDADVSASVVGSNEPEELSGMTPTEVADETRDRLRAALESSLGDSYDCGRVWEAWSVGTMSADDFSPVADRLDDVAEELMNALGLSGVE